MTDNKKTARLFPREEGKPSPFYPLHFCLICLMLLASCSTTRLSDSPFLGMRTSSSTSLPPGGHASLASGSGGYYKTGRPYRVGGHTYYPLSTARGYDETGIASWYGRDFHGKTTANGERYDMRALSAAHKTLPLPSLVRVTNLENGRSIVVRVNDRGPFAKGRLIDLSRAAANALGYARQGTTRVRVQALDTTFSDTSLHFAQAFPEHIPSSPSANKHAPVKRVRPSTAGLYVQIGAFTQYGNAIKLSSSLSAQYPSIRVQAFKHAMQTLYRVRIGPFSELRTIEKTILSLQRQGYGKTVVIIE